MFSEISDKNKSNNNKTQNEIKEQSDELIRYLEEYTIQNKNMSFNNLKYMMSELINSSVDSVEDNKINAEKVIKLLKSIISLLEYNNKEKYFIESIADNNFKDKNVKEYKEYINNIILFFDNLEKEDLYFFVNDPYSGFSNFLKLLKIKNIQNAKFNETKLIINGELLNIIKSIFIDEDFDKIIENIENSNKEAYKIIEKLFKNIFNLSKKDQYSIIYYFNAFKYDSNIEPLLDNGMIEIIKDELIAKNELQLTSKNIKIFSMLRYYKGSEFEHFFKYLREKGGNYATNKFISAFELSLIDINNIDNNINFKAYTYLITKLKKMGEKFEDIAESAGDIIKLYIILSRIYENKQENYKELDYLIKKCDLKKIIEFRKNLSVAYENKDKIIPILNYLKRERDYIYVENIIELFNKIGFLFFENNKINNYRIDEIINLDLIINNKRTDLRKNNLNNLIDILSIYAPNTAIYIQKHIELKDSIFNKADIKKKLHKLILNYIKTQEEFKTSINLDKINAVKIEIEEKRESKLKEKYEIKFIRDLENRIKLSQIEVKNNKISKLISSFNINKLILSKIINTDIEKIDVSKLNNDFINVIIGFASMSNNLDIDDKIKKMNIKNNEKILKEIIKIYYYKGNKGVLEYLDNMPQNKRLKKIMEDRGTDLEALKKFEYREIVHRKIRNIDDALRAEEREELIFYVSNDVMKNLNLGVTPSTCLNIIDGIYSFAAIPRAVDANNFTVFIKSSINDKIIGRVSLLDTKQGLLINSNFYIIEEYKDRINTKMIINFMKKLANKSNRFIIYPTSNIYFKNFFKDYELENEQIIDKNIKKFDNLEIIADYGKCPIIYSDFLGGERMKKDPIYGSVLTRNISAYCFYPDNIKRVNIK
jgi:hypothetical protein